MAEPRQSPLLRGLIGLAASVLASCAGGGAPAPAQRAAVPPPPSAPAEMPPRHAIPRPAHKPSPSPSTERSVPEAGGDALAMTEPEPAIRAPGAGAASSDPQADGLQRSGEMPTPSRAAISSPQPSELVGLDQAAAARLFGAATEKSEEPPSTVWRYKTATCELDLFFYLDLRSGRMRTLHYTFKGDATDAAWRQDCLRSLFAERGS